VKREGHLLLLLLQSHAIPMRSAACTRRRACRGDIRQRRRVSETPLGETTAVVVPFREQADQDRSVQLNAFLEHMSRFLEGTRCFVVIVQQTEDGRAFNRGQLLNVGFREAQRRGALTSVIFHDVDLLPSDGLRPWYVQAPKPSQPCHIAGPSTWGKYVMDGYEQVFFGGVTALQPRDFEAANGYPNNYWGWGAEDDQLRLRVDASGGLARGVVRPPTGAGRYTDLDRISMLSLIQTRESAMRHAHKFNPFMFQGKQPTRQLDPDWRGRNGLRGMQYEALSRREKRLATGVACLHVVAKLGE
jgi:hypothetical protein